MKSIDNYKIIRVHKYTSVVFAVLLEWEDSIFHDKPGRGDHEVRDFFFEVLTRAEQELKLRFPDKHFDLNDNKIAFEIEWQGATIYIGHRDLKYMIGCSVIHQGARVLDMETGVNSEYLVDRIPGRSKNKYTVSKVLWWIQKAVSRDLYLTFDVEGHQYDPETGWDFGVIDPLHFSIHGDYIITEGYSLKIYIRDITSLSLCKLESDKNGRSKIIPVR